jgi:hypothetical protein
LRSDSPRTQPSTQCQKGHVPAGTTKALPIADLRFSIETPSPFCYSDPERKPLHLVIPTPERSEGRRNLQLVFNRKSAIGNRKSNIKEELSDLR